MFIRQIRLRKLLCILFYLAMLGICALSILLNSDYNIIIKKEVINNQNKYDKHENDKFVSFDISKVIKTRFSLEEEHEENMKVYVIEYKNDLILLELTSSTVLTGSIDLMKMEENAVSKDLKETYLKENEVSKKFVKGYYTNVNFKENYNILKIKLLVTKVVGILCMLMMFINLILVINPKLTKAYKNEELF